MTIFCSLKDAPPERVPPNEEDSVWGMVKLNNLLPMMMGMVADLMLVEMRLAKMFPVYMNAQEIYVKVTGKDFVRPPAQFGINVFQFITGLPQAHNIDTRESSCVCTFGLG